MEFLFYSIEIATWSQSYQTFFFVKQRFSPFFSLKLGRFVVKALFSYVTNTQAKQQKLENEKQQSMVGLTPD
jgi:hypothetical protein